MAKPPQASPNCILFSSTPLFYILTEAMILLVLQLCVFFILLVIHITLWSSKNASTLNFEVVLDSKLDLVVS